MQIAKQIVDGLGQLQSMLESGSWRETMQSHPALAAAASWIQSHFGLGDANSQVLTGIRAKATQFLKGSLWSLIQLAVALSALFFFFRDREHVFGVLRSLTPLSEHEIDEVFERVQTMVRATIATS